MARQVTSAAAADLITLIAMILLALLIDIFCNSNPFEA
jgi:hypothetical protein